MTVSYYAASKQASQSASSRISAAAAAGGSTAATPQASQHARLADLAAIMRCKGPEAVRFECSGQRFEPGQRNALVLIQRHCIQTTANMHLARP